jgi:hypothetical protein
MIPALRQTYGAVFAALLQVVSYFLCPLHGGRHTKHCYIDGLLDPCHRRFHQAKPQEMSGLIMPEMFRNREEPLLEALLVFTSSVQDNQK